MSTFLQRHGPLGLVDALLMSSGCRSKFISFVASLMLQCGS